MSETETPTEDAVLDATPAVPTFQSTAAMPFAMSTGMRVRADLYDEDYTSDEYEALLTMYEGTMSQIVEGEIVKSKILRITDNAVILDVGFMSQGSVPLHEFKDPQNLQVGDEGQVFLEDRAVAAPFGITLPENHGVVGQMQQVVDGRAHYMCPTSSGIS